MGKDFESWLRGWEPDGQLANANSSKLPFDMGMQRIGITCPSPCADKVSGDGALPVFVYPELLNSMTVQVKQQPHGWFYCLPRFRKWLTSMPDTVLNGELLLDKDLAKNFPASAFKSGDIPDVGTACAAKQFLVFDQTGDKTTLICSSGIGTPVHCPYSSSPKPCVGDNSCGKEIGMARGVHYCSEPNLTDDDCRSADRSEMHEDTEEINALLYSDDEDGYPEDDEEISTGHSPSTMTAYGKQDWFEEGMEEVASSSRAAKRMKHSGGHYMMPSLMDTASSAKPKKLLVVDDDAESSSAAGFGHMGSLSGNKRLRKERIRQTVNVLQSLIPDGKNKDAIVVLDEAIHYLRTLKLKAKSLVEKDGKPVSRLMGAMNNLKTNFHVFITEFKGQFSCLHDGKLRTLIAPLNPRDLTL